MSKVTITGVLGFFLGLSGAVLIVWWLLLGLTQASGGSDGSFASMVMAPTWLPINILGLIATLLLVVGLSGFFTQGTSHVGILGFVGTAISIVGVVLFGALQFDETFIWPLLAQHAPGLMEPDGPMFSDRVYSVVYIVMGILFGVGFVVISVHSVRRRRFSLVLGVLLLVGALLFAGGSLIPIILRTAGVLLFGVALVWAGFRFRVPVRTKETER